MLNMEMIAAMAKALDVTVEPITSMPMQPGDVYLAHRNGPVKVLTCAKDDREHGWVVSMENAYSYDTHECFRVVKP